MDKIIITQEIKNQIAKEYLEKWIKMSDCDPLKHECSNCPFHSSHTKSRRNLCFIGTRLITDNNIDEIIEIINREEVTIDPKATLREAIKILDDACAVGVKNISSEAMPNFMEALELAMKVLKEKEATENE